MILNWLPNRMRVSERLTKDKLPRKWGVIPRFRSGTQTALDLTKLLVLLEALGLHHVSIAAKSQSKMIKLTKGGRVGSFGQPVSENYLCEKAYFLLATIYKNKVGGPLYDRVYESLNFEDYLILCQILSSKYA